MSIDPLKATHLMRMLGHDDREQMIREAPNVIDARSQFFQRKVAAQKPFGVVS